MGAWGAGLFEDDITLDMKGDFEAAIASGVPPPEAGDRMMEEYADSLEDLEDGPGLALALAALLIDHGVQQHAIFVQARQVIETGDGLDRWFDAGEEDLANRKAIYADLGRRLG